MMYSTHLQKRERRYRKVLISAEEERNFTKQGKRQAGGSIYLPSQKQKRGEVGKGYALPRHLGRQM